MVIDNFYILGAFGCPHEADAPLVVDADAVLALAVALQGFKPVAGRDTQVVQHMGRVQQAQLFQGGCLDIHPAAYPIQAKQGLGFRTLKGLDAHELQ